MGLNIYLSIFIPILKIFMGGTKFVARQPSILSMNNRRERSPRLYELLHRSSYRNYDLVICQSRYMRDDLVSNYNFPHIKTVVINNPIDIELVKERSLESVDYPFPKEYINLISVGNFRGEKRFDLLIESFSLLDDRYRLTLIGDGEKMGYG